MLVPSKRNGSEFKLNFEYLCDSYGIKHKPTTIKNPRECNIGTRTSGPWTNVAHS